MAPPTTSRLGTGAPGAAHGLEPLDAHNRALLDQVHPPDWTNPTPRDRYHLVVVGAGTGGLVTAAIAAGLGATVALVERHLMGGDCLNVGCVPSKAVIRAARAWADAASAARRFGGPEASGPGDFAAAMARMRRLRAGISPVDGARRFRDLGVDVFFGEGRFTGRDTLAVDGRSLRFRRAVVATGGRAASPPIPGLAEAGYLTNETVFGLETLPASLAVIGAGPIGCELAQAFARFGARVTLLEVAPRILPREDPEAAEIVARALERDGVRIESGVAVERVERRGEERVLHLAREGERLAVEARTILLAAGRTPNVEGLGLEAAGVRHDRGGVGVDARLRTSNRRIYAVGDVASAHQFTHAADAQARLVIANALFFGRGRADRLVMPWCTYTSPELAHVGLTAEQAAAAGQEVETITVPFDEVDRAILDGEEEGLLRVHLARGSDRVVGATLVAERAGDMISEITLAMTAKLGLGAVGQTIHPYPTQSEAFRKAADRWRRTKLTPLARRVLGVFFRVIR